MLPRDLRFDWDDLWWSFLCYVAAAGVFCLLLLADALGVGELLIHPRRCGHEGTDL